MLSATSRTLHCVVIAKMDLLCAHGIRQCIQRNWPDTRVESVTALQGMREAIEHKRPDILITGLHLPGGDVLDFLSSLSRPAIRLFVATTRYEPRILARLRQLPIAGIFDLNTEGPETLALALRRIRDGKTYWSDTILQIIQQDCLAPGSIFRRLTLTEELVLSIIGDGSDDREAAVIMDLAPATVASVLRALHRKLGIRHRGELVRFAAQHGFIRFGRNTIQRPGFVSTCAQRGRYRTRGASEATAACDINEEYPPFGYP